MGCATIMSTLEQEEELLENPFEYIPAEVHTEIFSYLTAKELCHSVAPVCKNWQHLSKDIYLWERLTVDIRCSKQLDSLYSLLKRCNLLRDITLTVCSTINKKDIYDISDCLSHVPLLKTLCLDWPHTHLSETVRFDLPRLKTLHMRALTAEDVNCIASGCPLIEELSLSCLLSRNTMRGAIEKLVNLRSLYLGNTFHGTFPSLPHLQTLYLEDGDLASIVTGCPLIERLELRCTVLAAKLQHLAGLAHLRSLCLHGDQLISEFPKLSQLKRFHLEMSKSLLEGRALDKIIAGCPLLENLELMCLGDEYALHYITKLRNLRSLILKGVEYIGSFPSLPLLKKLHLEMPLDVLESSVLEDIVSSCPLIEELHLSCERYVDVLYHIARLVNLRVLWLKGLDRVDLFPNLPLLKKLYLEMPEATLPERALEDIVSFCPLIEVLELKCQIELTALHRIQKLNHLRSFCLNGKNQTHLQF